VPRTKSSYVVHVLCPSCPLPSFALLDEQVRFLEGWFRDTLPGAPIERLAVLRLDGDLYESTMQALECL
jgi:hypothetical protein